ncbi:MAG: hypothetical protein WC815_23875 [Vicinamibacterales bacterium]|jgi:hypothetical protein
MNDQIAGLTLHFVSVASGLGKATIKTIQSRHPELQTLPYSTRAGGARIYFQPFIDWLAKYEGKEAADKLRDSKVAKDSDRATFETFRPRLSGALLRELRLSVKAGILQAPDPRRILGLDDSPANLLPFPMDSAMADARETLGDKGLRQIIAAASRIAKEAHDRKDADRKQVRLF